MNTIQHVDISSDIAKTVRVGIFSATAYALFSLWGWIPFLVFVAFVVLWRWVPHSEWWYDRLGWDTRKQLLNWIHWLSIPFSVVILLLRFGEEGVVGALIGWMAWWFIKL